MSPLPRRHLPTATSAALALGLLLLATRSAAHIELQLPMNRYSNIRMGENKACPCGSGVTSRRCNDPEDLSDPDRSADRVTTFAPGDTITVRFDEYVGHGGRMRIAFDPDGAELGDFNQHILLDEPDPDGKVGNIGEGSLWELQVTLPDMTCDNCTLQLIQVMDGNTEERVLDPAARGGTYFQCADIVLAQGTPAGGIPPVAPSEHLAERRRAEPAATAEAGPAEMSEGTAMLAPDAPSRNGGSATSSAADGNTSSAADGNTSVTMRPARGDEGGCSLVAGRTPRSGPPAFALAASVLAAALRRRRRPR